MVTGHGDIKANPDLITVSFAVDSTGATGDQCTNLQTEKPQILIDALKAVSGDAGKIETSKYSLNSHEATAYEPGAAPRMDHNSVRRKLGPIVGDLFSRVDPRTKHYYSQH
jgi:uncharacterized protein YggE